MVVAIVIAHLKLALIKSLANSQHRVIITPAKRNKTKQVLPTGRWEQGQKSTSR
ncbi:MAG: hypothetical protein ACI97K_003455 [Glaciecola sp.]|jgi:hypothetical protein